MNKRVLVAEDEPLVARMLQQSLQKAGYAVDVCADGKTARDRLVGGGYCALVTDWMMPELDGIELVRQASTHPERMYIALVSGLGIPAAVAHAKEAGADDFYAKPLVASRLVQGMSGWFDKLARGQIAPRAAAAAGPTADHPVARSECWKSLQNLLRQVLTETIQVPLGDHPAWDRAPEGAVVCMIPMADTEHHLELHLSVEASRASAEEITRTMLGDDAPDDATIADVFSELANISAGCLKTAFNKESVQITLGLPTKLATAEDFVLAARVGVRAKGIELVVRLGVRPQQARRVSASELREGMVLAENACNESGGLLLPAGTRLTATGSERLRGLLHARGILVCLPAQVA